MLSRWQSTIVDAQGNVQPFANLTVLDEATQAPAQIYASESLDQPLPAGSVVADESGYAYFYAPGGRYRIQSTALGLDWRHISLGTASALDVPAGQTQFGTASALDAIGTAPLYGRDSVVGTVSEDGGVPTGALVESGSHVNGTFWRFAGGMQVCAGAVEFNPTAISTAFFGGFRSVDVYFAWPAAFSSTPAATGDTGSGFGVTLYSPGTTVCAVNFLAVSSTSSEGRVLRYVAVGRWHE